MPDVAIEPKPIYTSRKLRIVCIGAGASGMVRLRHIYIQLHGKTKA
jgi:hypothetical protein